MRLSKPVGLLAAAAVVVWAIGAVVTFLTGGLLSSGFTTDALVVTALTAVAVLAAAVVGAKNREWLANPASYW